MTERKQNLSIVRALRRIVPINIKAAPGYYLMYALLSALHGASIGLVAPVNQRLYDALVDLAGSIGGIRYVFISAALVTGLMLWGQAANALHNFHGRQVLSPVVKGRLMGVIHNKLKLLPAKLFEDKDILDDIEKAAPGMDGSIYLLGDVFDFLFFYATYYVIMSAFLWNMRPLLLIALLITFVPVLLAQVAEAKLKAKLEEASAPIRRQNSHYGDCIIGREKMKETRLFGAYHFFKRLYMDSLALLAQKEWNVQKKISFIYLAINTLKAAGWVGIVVLLFQSIVQGYITVGAFAAVFGSVGMFFGMVEELSGRVRRGLTQNLGKIHNYINFLDIPVLLGNESLPDINQGIIATSIKFTYPKSDKPAVDGISLHIRPGETLALVGENGSGKTTLVKLLCGLYAPDTGTVTIGGCDTSNTSTETMFSKTSAIFQNYVHYDYNLDENVRISQPYSTSGPISALQNADIDPFDTETFPAGLETILSREFGGVQLSGGQCQRIATARGLYRAHNFIVLDEPTAAIDPLEETRIYNRFAQLTRDKTAILVTHRIGSIKIADRIVVMDNGKIVETGTHESLLAIDGKYTKMWKSQAEQYT